MRRLAVGILGLLTTAPAAQAEYNYHEQTERLIARGTQALMICNGLFVSNRTLDQIYDQELKLDEMPVLPREGVQVDDKLQTVAVGGAGNPSSPVMRAAYREGLGCIVLSPDQTFADVDSLPQLRTPPLPGDAATILWPEGDLVSRPSPPPGVDAKALEAAWDWALDRKTHGHPSQITLSLLVVYRGDLVFERYGPGVDMKTRTRTWSTAKSIASALTGIAVSQGKLALDSPLPYPEGDPRRAVTLRHVLNMSSGLDPVDNHKCSVVGSCLSYFGGTSSVAGALDRGLMSQPGTRWDYENYDTLLVVHALKTAVGAQDYLAFPRKALLDRVGMRNTVLGVDRFGDFVLSSQVYTNARDLARFGLLYLNRGRWPHPGGETIIPESWIDFSRTPAPATTAGGRFYGGQWWLVPDDRKDVPADAYATNGNRGQYTIVVPSYDLVIVRRGLDWLPHEHSFPRWDLTREVLKAFPKRPWGEKPAAALAATAPAAGSDTPKRDASIEPELKRALGYLQAGQPARAAELVRSLLPRRDTAEMRNLLGDAEEAAGHLLAAAEEFQKAAHMDPSEEHLFDWGNGLLRLRAFEPASRVFVEAVKRHPRSARLEVGLGIAEYSRGQYDDAVRSFCAAADLDPSDPRPYVFLGEMYGVSPDLADEVTRRLALLVQTHPENALGHFHYAMSLWKGRADPAAPVDAGEVERLLKRAVALDPGLASAHFRLGALLFDQGRYAEAARALRKAIRLQPDLAEARYRLAQVYLRTGEKASAERELEAFRKLGQKGAEPAPPR